MKTVNYLIKYAKNSSYFNKFTIFLVKIVKTLVEHMFFECKILKHNNTEIAVVDLPCYKNIFCGYYDVTPFSPTNNDLLLVHATNYSADSLPDINKNVDIILLNSLTGKYELIDKTSAWNWQQGARCQWLNSNLIAYNIIVNGEVRCKVKNIETNEEKVCPINLNIAYKDQYIVSADYFALTISSEYGYRGLDKDGSSCCIKIYYLETGNLIELFNWKDCNILSGLMQYKATRPHINHILPTLDGDGFVFIFRYWIKEKRYDSLLHFDISSKKMSVLIANQTVSHYAWRNNYTLFAWLVNNSKPGYYMIDLRSKEVVMSVPIDDGHPSYIIENKFITDISKQSWLHGKYLTATILNTQTKEQYDLVTLSHPTVLSNCNRCDLHISLSKDGTRFQLDSRHLYRKRSIIIGHLAK